VKLKISEVPLPDARWQVDHFKALLHSYRPAPFFHQIEPFLNEFYRCRTWKLLSDLNHYSIESIAGLLGLKTKFLDSKNFQLEGGRLVRLVSLLQQIGAKEYLSGPSARSYIAGSEDAFEEAGIRVTFKSYEGYPEYRQLHRPFEHAVSVLDVLANVELSDCRRCITAAPASEPCTFHSTNLT